MVPENVRKILEDNGLTALEFEPGSTGLFTPPLEQTHRACL